MSTPWLYRLEDVTQRHGAQEVLRISRLEVARGELLCLVGPTGAGKSTLLRLLADLEKPALGQVRFEGQALDGRADLLQRRRITLVFQRPLLMTGTVWANVAYGLRLRGRRGHLPQVQATLDKLGLGCMPSRWSRALSGGEIQLVALARALALEPEVLLLDEPTSHLDPARVGLVEEVIASTRRQRGMTVVWATHNLFQARRVAERVALLLDGRLVEALPTRAFFEASNDTRTAAFVRGEMVY